MLMDTFSSFMVDNFIMINAVTIILSLLDWNGGLTLGFKVHRTSRFAELHTTCKRVRLYTTWFNP